MKIDTTNWEEFRVDKLFDVESSPGFDMVNIDISNTMDDEYKYEFIIRSKDNYGVKGYVKHLGIESNKKNKITISQVGTIVAQYRDSDYYTTQNVFNLTPKFNLTENKALFFVNIFNCMLRKYIGYSDYPTKKSLRSEVILLPAIDSDTPDFDYMEEYIEEMKFKYIDELEKDNDLNIDKALEVTGLSYEDLDKDLIVEPADRYEEFRVGDLFETSNENNTKVLTGAYLSKDILNENLGDIPRITVTSYNNGVSGYYKENIDDSNYRVYENFISVSFLGDCFYQKNKASLDMKVHCLKLRDYEMNPSIGLYIATILKRVIQIYSYGSQLSSEKLADVFITLPAKDCDTPDFDYMEKAIYIYILQKRLSLKNYLIKKK